MFDAHGWDNVPGNKLTVWAQGLIKKNYGSIRSFEATHEDASDIWDRGYDVLFTSVWVWEPDKWAAIGWSDPGGEAKRDNLLKELTDPFIMVCYVTKTSKRAEKETRGKIVGFYLVSHKTGHRNEFCDPVYHKENPGKWAHAVRALRAFSFFPEDYIDADKLYPELLPRYARTIASHARLLDPGQVDRLREMPWREDYIYKSAPALRNNAVVGSSSPSRGMVRAGPASNEGYFVSGGTQLLPYELYILRLEGDTDAYLGYSANGRQIIKIGMAVDSERRKSDFQRALPKGAFRWATIRTMRSRNLPPCSSHSIAVKGEDAMKNYLKENADWFDGEFYLANEQDIDEAWKLGCQAARAARDQQ